jgi:hypothetical protein
MCKFALEMAAQKSDPKDRLFCELTRDAFWWQPSTSWSWPINWHSRALRKRDRRHKAGDNALGSRLRGDERINSIVEERTQLAASARVLDPRVKPGD